MAAWPSVKQIARVHRFRQVKRKGLWVDEHETAWLITSLSPDQATPADILRFNRKHWSIENLLHRTKDVMLGEDRSTVRSGSAPAVLATLNNLAIAIFKASRLSPTRAIEHFQDNKSSACHALTRFY